MFLDKDSENVTNEVITTETGSWTSIYALKLDHAVSPEVWEAHVLELFLAGVKEFAFWNIKYYAERFLDLPPQKDNVRRIDVHIVKIYLNSNV